MECHSKKIIIFLFSTILHSRKPLRQCFEKFTLLIKYTAHAKKTIHYFNLKPVEIYGG